MENKFHAELTRRQPVKYLEALRDHRESVLAFIAPAARLEILWEQLKEKCDSEGVLAEESPPVDPRRIRVGNRTMLITSWKRVLDALQEVAAKSGLSAVEQDIAQLRGLAESATTDGL